ncbi:MAG: hypothetical protein ACI4W7_05355 [Candidatus Spyradenecus sp.]
MAEPDTRRWSLRDPQSGISNNNIPTATLVQWAERGIIKPGCEISADGETWVAAASFAELGMRWFILSSGHPPYGPVTQAAGQAFIAEGRFGPDARLAQDPGEQQPVEELPLPLELPPPNPLSQELEEARQKLTLLEREVRVKDRRIAELRQEATARQSELAIEGAEPDAKTLAAELEQLRLERDHLKRAAEEAAEAAAGRERELRQRLHTLETALETAQAAAQNAHAELPPDEALFAILTRETDWLRQSQEEENRFLEALRDLAHRRLVQLSERLLEIRRLAGDSPEQMRANARVSLPPSLRAPIPPPRREDPSRIAELEKALAEARARESALQRQLVSGEGRETELRAQIGQAQRQTLDSLKLDEKLRETVQALGRERAAREEEHRENAHIQAQLLRRIEELERLLPSARDLPAPDPVPAAEPQRPSFGWLKRH